MPNSRRVNHLNDAPMKSALIQLEPHDNELERLRRSCGDWSCLSLESVWVECGDITICGPLPHLVCNECGAARLPNRTKGDLQGIAEEARRQNSYHVMVDFEKTAIANKRLGLCESEHLAYSAIDYFYIPGLHRRDGSGFLTPVFFSIDALMYFDNHPGYFVVFASDTYGTVYAKDGGYISFGLNRSDKLVMWLGDIAKLSKRDLKVFAAHNVPSDHDVGSEFYAGQIEIDSQRRRRNSV